MSEVRIDHVLCCDLCTARRPAAPDAEKALIGLHCADEKLVCLDCVWALMMRARDEGQRRGEQYSKERIAFAVAMQKKQYDAERRIAALREALDTIQSMATIESVEIQKVAVAALAAEGEKP